VALKRLQTVPQAADRVALQRRTCGTPLLVRRIRLSLQGTLLPPRYCPEGTYKNASYLWDTLCFDCQPCPAGLYRIGCTGASAGTCIACPDHLRKTDEGSWGPI